jgi:hypothetical protein
MSKVFQIKYNANGRTKYAYFLEKTEVFYDNYLDCREQNEKKLPIIEQVKIKEGLEEKKIDLKNIQKHSIYIP